MPSRVALRRGAAVGRADTRCGSPTWTKGPGAASRVNAILQPPSTGLDRVGGVLRGDGSRPDLVGSLLGKSVAGQRGDSSLPFVFLASVGALLAVGVIGFMLGDEDDQHRPKARSVPRDAARNALATRGQRQAQLANVGAPQVSLPALSERPAWESLRPQREPTTETSENPATEPTVEPIVPTPQPNVTPTSVSDTQLLADLDRHMGDLLRMSELPDPAMEVQHILIGFVKADGNVTVPGKPITRTQAEAKLLVAKLLHRAKTENFDALVREFTEDSHPGIYAMHGPNSNAEEAQRLLNTSSSYPRRGMVSVFGDCGWRLRIGEVGVLDYHPQSSPYGWHIVKRLK